MDTAVQQLQSAVDALREVFEWPGIVIFAKKIQEVFFFGDAWAAQKNKVSAEGQRLAHASVLISEDDFTDGAFRFQIWGRGMTG